MLTIHTKVSGNSYIDNFCRKNLSEDEYNEINTLIEWADETLAKLTPNALYSSASLEDLMSTLFSFTEDKAYNSNIYIAVFLVFKLFEYHVYKISVKSENSKSPYKLDWRYRNENDDANNTKTGFDYRTLIQALSAFFGLVSQFRSATPLIDSEKKDFTDTNFAILLIIEKNIKEDKVIKEKNEPQYQLRLINHLLLLFRSIEGFSELEKEFERGTYKEETILFPKTESVINLKIKHSGKLVRLKDHIIGYGKMLGEDNYYNNILGDKVSQIQKFAEFFAQPSNVQNYKEDWKKIAEEKKKKATSLGTIFSISASVNDETTSRTLKSPNITEEKKQKEAKDGDVTQTNTLQMGTL